jgi:Fic family protein
MINLGERLLQERASNYKGGLYHLTQLELAYNSNRIEGSSFTKEQTMYLYDTQAVFFGDNDFVKKDDVIEMNNHFILFNHMLDTCKDTTTGELIKTYHRILKYGTSPTFPSESPIGKYKVLPNTVAGIATSEPYQVAEHIDALTDEYLQIEEKTIADLIDFHVRFERIHPFFDGNGRVGRMLLFKECLANDIIPFVIKDENKETYYRGLKEYTANKDYLITYCLREQDEYLALVEKFVVG